MNFECGSWFIIHRITFKFMSTQGCRKRPSFSAFEEVVGAMDTTHCQGAFRPSRSWVQDPAGDGFSKTQPGTQFPCRFSMGKIVGRKAPLTFSAFSVLLTDNPSNRLTDFFLVKKNSLMIFEVPQILPLSAKTVKTGWTFSVNFNKN